VSLQLRVCRLEVDTTEVSRLVSNMGGVPPGSVPCAAAEAFGQLVGQ